MGNFNKVFAVIQKHCNENASLSGVESFRKIAVEGDVPVERLHVYLECLNDVGVINYSSKKEVITLTKKGVKAARIFP